MLPSGQRKTNVKSLADLIERDIRRRGLRSGDAYLTSIQAAKRFGVSTRSANSALQLLAQRRVLRRRQRLGTVITLDEHLDLPDAPLEVVHLLMHETYMRREGLLADGVVVGIQGVMPKAQMQFNFLPPSDDEQQVVTELIQSALKARQRAGFVVVRASLEMQRIVGRSGMPTVVHGTICPSVDNVSSLDRDNAQAGRLLVEHFVKSGCRNLLLLLRNTLFPGHFPFFDAIFEAVAEFDIDVRHVIQRYLPSDELTVERELLRLADRAFADKCGVICDARPLAEGAYRTIQTMALPPQRRPEIVASTLYLAPGQRLPPYPYLSPQISPQEIGQRIGQLLLEQASHQQTPRHETYPVTIVDPRATSNR